MVLSPHSIYPKIRTKFSGMTVFKWTLKNNDGTDSSMNCLPCFLMDKIEVNQGDRTLETIRDLDYYLV